MVPYLVIQEFASKIDPAMSKMEMVDKAVRITQAAIDNTKNLNLSVDDEDGLDFSLRLANGYLVMANLFHDGSIDASVYDDSQGIPVKTIKRMPRYSTTEDDLINLFMATEFSE